jgi:hypothetical protein
MRDESKDLRRTGRDDRRSGRRRRPRQSVQYCNPRVGLGPDYRNLRVGFTAIRGWVWAPTTVFGRLAPYFESRCYVL